MSASQTFASRYGPWALVTGAARGLGTEFSRQIARLGVNVVLVDLLADELAQVAQEVKQDSGREVRTIVADLSRPEFMDVLRQEAEGMEVNLLVCNAGLSPVGLFFEHGLEENLDAVAVNVRSTLMLVHEFGAKMVARKRGGIILLSSASALQGCPYVANYAATKAYNLILAESLWKEFREHGVDVLGFMPGATRTPGFIHSEPRLERSRLSGVMEPAPTVAEALKALGRAPSHIAGKRNRWSMCLITRLLPRKTAISLIGNTMRAWYGKQ